MKSTVLSLMFVVVSYAISVAQVDLTPTMLFPVDYLPVGTHTFDVMVDNIGPSYAPYNGYKIGWCIDNGTITEGTPTIPTYPITSNTSERVAGNFTISFSAPGVYMLKVWTRSTSFTDANTANDTIIKKVKVLPYVPPKNVVFEIFKHQACCPCIDAAAYADTAIVHNAQYAVAAIYTGPTDILYNADGDVINDLYGLAHPVVFLDRFLFPYKTDLENGFFVANNLYQLRNMKERDRYYEPIEVSFSEATFDANTRLLKVKLKAKAYDTISGNYRFNLYLTEDSVQAYQGCANPSNTYYHKHILRHMFGGTWGQVNSMPATLYPGQEASYEFSYTLPSNYKLQHLELIGLVQQFNNNKLNSRILNSKKISFSNALVLSSKDILSTTDNIDLYPNPATDKVFINWKIPPTKPVTVELIDGNGKKLRTFFIDAYVKEIDLSGLPSATYTIKLIQNNKVNSYQILKN